LFLRKKDYKKAIETIKKAIELNDEGSFYFKLGRYLFLDGQKQEAEKTWLKAVNEKKFTQIKFKQMTYAVLADYYFKEKDYKKSLENIEKAIELAPDNNLYIRFYNQIKLLAK
jgi:tetratricopeptide (TPR) repeat protein